MNCCCCGWGPFGFNPGDDLIDFWGFDAVEFGDGPEVAWSVAAAWNVTAGGEGVSGSLSYQCAPPATAWNVSSVAMQAKVLSAATQAGVFIGNVRRFWVDEAQKKFFYQPCGQDGEPVGTPTAIAGAVPSAGGGDTLTVAFSGIPASAQYAIKYTVVFGDGQAALNVYEGPATLSAFDPIASIEAGVWTNAAALFRQPQLICGPVITLVPPSLNCAASSWPAAWTVEIGGIANGTCAEGGDSQCPSLNGTWTLEIGPQSGIGIVTLWEGPVIGSKFCDFYDLVSVQLICGTPDFQGEPTQQGLYLAFNSFWYFLALADCNPMGPNTLKLIFVNGPGQCVNLPETLTVVPE